VAGLFFRARRAFPHAEIWHPAMRDGIIGGSS
jgi:hypothetical protein